MIKTLLIGGLTATIAAGAAFAQTTQPPAPPPAAGAEHQMHGPGAGGPGPGPGMMRGPGPGGPGPGMMQRGGRRGGFGAFGGGRNRPTLEQMQQRNAQMFAELDANKDGRATQAEFTAMIERRKAEREKQMFQRFSGGSDSVTLDQLNARTAERMNQRPNGPGGGGRGR